MTPTKKVKDVQNIIFARKS